MTNDTFVFAAARRACNTAHGFGYYYLANILTTQDWKAWRFHGSINGIVRSEEKRDILVRLADYKEIIRINEIRSVGVSSPKGWT